MSTDGQGTKFRRKIAQIYNRLSRVHERYRQTTDRQTDGRQQFANRTAHVGARHDKKLETRSSEYYRYMLLV